MVAEWRPDLSGVEFDAAVTKIDDLFAVETARSATPVTDLEVLFGRLRIDGYRLGIATNDVTRSAHACFEHLELSSHLDFITGYDGVETAKPAPDMAHAFCAACGIEPRDIVVVGDNIHDLEMGVAAGVGLTVGVLTGNAAAEDFGSPPMPWSDPLRTCLTSWTRSSQPDESRPDMFYDAIENRHGLKHDPFKSLVVPRPIGWISSLSSDGVLNLAPYSFFNAVSARPNIVMFSSGGRKDSAANVEATGEFVCNMATWDLREAMNESSATVDSAVDEFELAGLQTVPSKLVKPPRVAASPVALECTYLQTVELPPSNGEPNLVVFGQVVGIHIDDDVIVDGMVDVTKFKPVARLGYHDYAVVEDVFSMVRPS